MHFAPFAPSKAAKLLWSRNLVSRKMIAVSSESEANKDILGRGVNHLVVTSLCVAVFILGGSGDKCICMARLYVLT
jgi:hypothetical protein